MLSLISIAAGAALVAVIVADQVRSHQDGPVPPTTRKGDVEENHFGTLVPDPYRWLEDAESDETKGWVKAQNAVTFDYLRSIPEWHAARKRIEELYTFERFGIPEIVGHHLVYTHNTGLQNQSVYLIADKDGKNPRTLLDPNQLSTDGTVAVGSSSFSPDGKYFAYALTKGGSDWQEWHVRDVATARDLSDVIPWAKFSGAAWNKASNGFYYSAYDPPKEAEALQAKNVFQKIYFHKIGTLAKQDVLVYEDSTQPEYFYGVGETEDGKYLVLTQFEGTRPQSRVYIKDLGSHDAKFRPIHEKFDAAYHEIGNDGSKMYFLTDNGATRRRIIAVDLNNPEPSHWNTVVPEAAETLSSASLIGTTIYASYLKDAHSVIRRFDTKGESLGEVALPGLGTASGFSGKRVDTETFFDFNSYTDPGSIFRLDVRSGDVKEFRRPKLCFNPAEYETKQVFYSSKDGTQVPMFISYKKGLKLSGENPTVLYGYGGFNVSITPGFSVGFLQWMEAGGVVAVPNIRGGGEYGLAWYDAGRLKNKQNVFDDFIAAAEYLIKAKYTSTPRLAIRGGSNGGLLVGACEAQRPDLFAACVPEVGVMDVLRFHKFTIGAGWKSDYGDPEVEADFRVAYKYSPIHNLKPNVKYPATLVMTGDHDDRVVPAHSYKFAATLQAAQSGRAPVLIRIETSAGHGGGMPMSKRLDASADMFVFLVKNLDMKMP